jgi:nucleoside-diphosphate-sugar epimerase
MESEKKSPLLVTGASGFIGENYFSMSRFKTHLKGISIRHDHVKTIELSGVETVLHFAGKAHEMKKINESVYFTANRDLAYEFAKKAKASGVKQFIYLSSVKVYGKDATTDILNENSPCTPNDPYGQSKLEGEQQLLSLQEDSFVVSIIRPPLVYGVNVKGNFIKLIKLADSNKLLPFAAIQNKRSMVYVGNLVALIDKLIEVRKSGVFIAGDIEPLSTAYLVELIRKYLDKPRNLFQMPNFVLKPLRFIKPALVNRLYDSLVFDNSTTNKVLNFIPPFSSEEGIKQMVDWYLQTQKS